MVCLILSVLLLLIIILLILAMWTHEDFPDPTRKLSDSTKTILRWIIGILLIFELGLNIYCYVDHKIKYDDLKKELKTEKKTLNS